MRVRTPAGDRARSASETGSAADGSSGWHLVRHILGAVGVLVVTYLVMRVLGPRDDVPIQSVDEVRAEMGDIVPDDVQRLAADAVPDDRSIDTIRNRTGGAVPTDITDLTDAIEGNDESESTALDEAAPNADYADDRSDHEIAERTEPDVREEPPAPGEMTVDEDLPEDLTDADTETMDESDDETDTESEE
ncbi:hypothetical protein [Natrinema salinisoli]|uniref:hypothetical protein n=1 Tax=Natrinema salinisoli TaxID=2878535 RepID=UPI001CF02FB6|nr:hypothetical protein [Natrinema salinisoli]